MTRSVTVLLASGLLAGVGTSEVAAQERIWFADSDTKGELFGWMRVGPDLDGDGVPEFTLSASYGACTQPNQGWVSVHSLANGELQCWCGTGASTGFSGGVWVGDVDGLGVPDVVIGEPYYDDPRSEERRVGIEWRSRRCL